jgi:hypothetical protein
VADVSVNGPSYEAELSGLARLATLIAVKFWTRSSAVCAKWIDHMSIL